MDKDTLFVCWNFPTTLPNNNVVVLSFLNPYAEEDLKNKFDGELISARKIAPEVKEKARNIYLKLIANIGATPIKERGNKTLRQALVNKRGFSLWWIHKVSEKDCETEPTFEHIVEIFIIIYIANLFTSKHFVFLGGSKEVKDVLKDFYNIDEIKCRRRHSKIQTIVKCVISRVKYCYVFLLQWFVLKRAIKNFSGGTFDIVFSGFWDWSVKTDRVSGALCDRYFKLLPEKLLSKGLRIGWFLWFDPCSEPGSKGRKLWDVLEPINKRDNLVILQKFLTVSDLLKAIFNFKPYLIFLQYCKTKEFKDAFIVDGINFLALLQHELGCGFLNAIIPMHELVCISTERAFNRYRPEKSVSFLELFIYSRAFYAGGKLGFPSTIHYAIQHASYSREKTFVLLDPQLEYKGCPDDIPIPRPDYIFTMGELGKEIFMESGFPGKRLYSTGSPRYEHIKGNHISSNEKPGNVTNVLIVTSLDINLEIEMVEAVYFASLDLPQIRLLLRRHPFAKIDKHPDFHKYTDRIHLTDRTLEEDLMNADLIIFSYSTIAEEALIQGIPVWQWQPITYNGSVFRDLRCIPSFYSVSDLRESLREFVSNKDAFIPGIETRSFILKKCFYDGSGSASERIADILSA
ncbi:MAG: hypothetical protein HYV59_04230 [Planctomycetes bacterium]|nr:hypothetical protein [Planctomycetota bacterium]